MRRAGHEGQLPLPFKPPILVLILVTAGFVADSYRPLPISEELMPRIAVGALVLLLGIAMMRLSRSAFAAHGEHFSHHEATSTVVRTGPYRRSRNPVYLAMMLIIAGVAIIANTAWLFITFHMIGFPILHWLVVLPEESYLRRNLGPDYEAYCAEVRRWL